MQPALIDTLREAVRQRPQEGAPRLQLANLLLEAGRPQEALEHFATLVEQSPDNADALDGAAVAAASCGEEARAAEYRASLARIGPPRRGGARPRLRVVDGGSG